MTDPERSQIREEIQQCQERRRLGIPEVQLPPEEPSQVTTQEVDDGPTAPGLEQVDECEEAIRRERLSLLAQHATMEIPTGSGATSSGSTQPLPEEWIVHVEHASFASPHIVTTRLSKRTVLQRHIRSGRTRVIVSGEYVPDAGEGRDSGEEERDSTISAINGGTVKGDHTEDHYIHVGLRSKCNGHSMEGRNEGRSYNVCLGGR